MPKWKKLSLILVSLVMGIFVLLTWYKLYYSMEVAESFEVTAQDPQYQLLIATQGSKFKNAVVANLIEALSKRPIFIKVIDVSGLSSINPDEWSAVVILHTWENWKPQQDAELFLNRLPDFNKVAVVTTSGEGDLRIEGVDAITSASVISDVPSYVAELVRRIDAIIGKGEN